ncbi:MAG TPA: response regulator, partial [Dehalococcoidia bacterium]|nr:response regulator [Dehalococcoidia bacterium]
MARTPEVLVVDQDLQTRFEIKRLVKQTQLNVVGEAAFGTEGVSLAAEVKPDVIVCGMSRPPERALQTIESLLDNLPETPVIVYSWQQDLETVRQAMLAGVRDFLVMPVDAGQLSRSISAVLEAEEKKRVRSNGQGHLLGARGLVLTVFGAKGGVGKTTLATNLAVALSSQGLSVVLVDADTSFGDVAGMLDLPLQHSIIDLLREVDKLDRDSITDYLMQHQSGLWVSPAPKESLRWRSVSPERVRKTIALLAKRFDMVVVDTGVLLAEVSLT